MKSIQLRNRNGAISKGHSLPWQSEFIQSKRSFTKSGLHQFKAKKTKLRHNRSDNKDEVSQAKSTCLQGPLFPGKHTQWPDRQSPRPYLNSPG
mmetsp:Transcript_36148/g.95996  ORF Transcript_36148/g.95996 Transcript_36148/m.95996 type:complete len:93 (-) Transcript_36148:663-941(-)